MHKYASAAAGKVASHFRKLQRRRLLTQRRRRRRSEAGQAVQLAAALNLHWCEVKGDAAPRGP